MEMEMNESPMNEIENYSDESTTTDSSGDSGGSFSPPLKRLRKVSTDTTMITADDDTDSKTSSTRSSISEEFGEPVQPQQPPSDQPQQPSDPPQAVVSTDTTMITADDDTDSKTSSTRSSISEEFGEHVLSQQPSDQPQQPSDPPQAVDSEDTWISLIRQTYPRPQPNIETFEVDPKWLAAYAREALDYFEETMGEVYRYEGPRSMCLCSFPDSEYKVTHINFFAVPHGKLSESLFFAALEHGPVRKVVECCIVPLFKAGDGVVPFIKHPRHVECSECSKFGEAVLCFEVEEEQCCMPWSYWSSV